MIAKLFNIQNDYIVLLKIIFLIYNFHSSFDFAIFQWLKGMVTIKTMQRPLYRYFLSISSFSFCLLFIFVGWHNLFWLVIAYVKMTSMHCKDFTFRKTVRCNPIIMCFIEIWYLYFNEMHNKLLDNISKSSYST